MIQGSKHHTVDLLDWQILQYEPFTSDRDSHVRVLSDVMVVTRKLHLCMHCFATTKPGERCRRRTEVNYDMRRTMSFYFCADCCEAMRGLTTGNDWEAFEGRFMLHCEDRHAR